MIHRDAVRCPRYGSTLRRLAAIEDPVVASLAIYQSRVYRACEIR